MGVGYHRLVALVDPGSFVEYGELAVAAQRGRRDIDDLIANTPGDGVITGIATINAAVFGEDAARVAVVINDYSVLAGTQGFYHHGKIDRMLELAARDRLPVVMYTEGGGGRPGDTRSTCRPLRAGRGLRAGCRASPSTMVIASRATRCCSVARTCALRRARRRSAWPGPR